MRAQPSQFQPSHRLLGVAATVALHFVLIGCWLLTDRVADQKDGGAVETIQWVDIKAPVEKAAAPVVPVTPRIPVAPRVTVATPAPRASEMPVPEAASEPVAAAAPARNAQDILQQARRDIGRIGKELKQEFPEQHIKAPADTPQSRLVKGIELANELAPPRWYEQSKVKELIDPGGYGRKRYRVITAIGTYCITYDSPQSPDGREPTSRGATPKYTNCPPNEEPAKPQKW